MLQKIPTFQDIYDNVIKNYNVFNIFIVWLYCFEKSKSKFILVIRRKYILKCIQLETSKLHIFMTMIFSSPTLEYT